MIAQVGINVLPPLRFLLTAGGLPLLGFGIVFSLWGVWNIIRTQRFALVLSQLALSVLPGLIAAVIIYAASVDFTEMAVAETPPKPAALAATAGRAMSYGFCGLLSTVIPVLLGTVAVRRHYGFLRSDCRHDYLMMF